MENKFKVGDSVVWDFVFDMPNENGVIVGLDGDKVQVEYKGYVLGGNYKMYRDWLSCEEVDLEENYV